MSDKPKTIYCGNGRKISTQNGSFRSVSICLSDIPKEFITTSEKNQKKYVRIIVSDKDQKDQYGNDVFVTVDQWKPDPNYKKSSQSSETPQQQTGNFEQPTTQQGTDDDLPL